jgi:hypothetical protein
MLTFPDGLEQDEHDIEAENVSVRLRTRRPDNHSQCRSADSAISVCAVFCRGYDVV